MSVSILGLYSTTGSKRKACGDWILIVSLSVRVITEVLAIVLKCGEIISDGRMPGLSGTKDQNFLGEEC